MIPTFTASASTQMMERMVAESATYIMMYTRRRHHKHKGQCIQRALGRSQLVRHDNGSRKEGKGLKTIGLCGIGTCTPISLAGQPGARIVIVVPPLAAGLAEHASFGNTGAYKRQQGRQSAHTSRPW